MASRITRPVPVTVGDVLDGHVKLDLDCLDRLYLHGYLARLQVGGQVIQFLNHRGYPVPSRHACSRSRNVAPQGGVVRRGQPHPGSAAEGR